VDIDQHIPHELYLAVAELLAWLYRLEHGYAYGDPPAFDLQALTAPHSP
jgi:flagellar biosynthesis protein